MTMQNICCSPLPILCVNHSHSTISIREAYLVLKDADTTTFHSLAFAIESTWSFRNIGVMVASTLAGHLRI